MSTRSSFKYAQQRLRQQHRTALASTIGGVLAAGSLQAATITVTTLDDGFVAGQCSLRSALAAANSNAPVDACVSGSVGGTDQIVFESGLAGTIQLQPGVPVQNFWDGSQLAIEESVSIVGPTTAQGSNAITVVGTGAAPVVYVDDATDLVSIQHLTLSGGYSPEDLPARPGHGGGILSYGRVLSLDGVMIANNAAARGGGGVWHAPSADNGVLIAQDCLFAANSAGLVDDGDGGGMAIRDSVVSINNCYFVGNQVGGALPIGSGGALSIERSPLTGLVDSSFVTNRAYGGQGGAVHFSASQSQLYLAGNLFDRNLADGHGGALSILDEGSTPQGPADLQLLDNEFLLNQSGGAGGGFYLASGPGQLRIENSQWTDNLAASEGGAGHLRLDRTDLDWLNGSVSNNLALGTNGGGGISIRASEGALGFDRIGFLRNIADDGCGGAMSIVPLIGLTGPDSIVINDSVVFANDADCGGGLDLFLPTSNPVDILLENNEWSSNEALGERLPGEGGALYFNGGADSLLVLSNSTVSGNEAAVSGGGVFVGGSGVLSAKYATFAENSALGFGHEIMSDGADCQIRNSILASPDEAALEGSSPCSVSHSLLRNSQAAVASFGPNVMLDVDPLLGPLIDNGQTQWMLTHAPQAGSPVIDAGDASIGLPDFDQRGDGFPRVQGTALDLGALESDPAPSDRIFSDRFDGAN